MYNRYIPDDTGYVPVEKSSQAPPRQPQPPPEPLPRPGSRSSPFSLGKEGLGRLFSSQEGGKLSSLLKAWKLDRLDTGDILLLLIILYLFFEGDEPELAVALALVLVLGLLDDAKERDKKEETD